MKVVLDTKYKLKSLDFCCHDIGRAILDQDIVPHRWSDHCPSWWFNHDNGGREVRVDHCPFCGAKITGKIGPD